jgi:RNA polymerase sigma-70 factor (ECF subfamily)
MGTIDEDPRTSRSDDLGRTAWLARAVQGGDLARFEELYSRVAPALQAWASLRAPQGVDPGDIVGEIWLNALRSLRSHEAGDHEFRAWIFGVAKNVLLQTLRRLPRERARGTGTADSLSRSPLEECPQAVTSIFSRLARDDALSAFLDRARSFDPIDRELLVRCGLEGSLCTVAATRLGISSEAATKRWQRLRADLRTSPWVHELLV